MYRQLQEKVKEYIVGDLCAVSEEWKFSIDMFGDEIFVVGCGHCGLVIRAKIEEIHKHIPKELIKRMGELWDINYSRILNWGGCIIIRHLLNNVFNIYKVPILCDNIKEPIRYTLFDKNSSKGISSDIYSNSSLGFISPFLDHNFNKYIVKEQLVPPFLLLLDPIEYFRRYSIIIDKYSDLDDGHILGIYELLLGYFPEMNNRLVERYWVVEYIFSNLCIDIVFVIGQKLIRVYC